MSDTALDAWLSTLEKRGDDFVISAPRRYESAEGDYDEDHAPDADTQLAGRGVLNVLRSIGADLTGPALEIGCGTGKISVGILAADTYPRFLITDPSPQFLALTRRKIVKAGVDQASARYALLVAEELDRLPVSCFSLIALRSALHHVEDIERFIRDASRALRPGGVLSFQEPCLEGFLIAATALQLLPALAEARGAKLRDEHLARVREFIDMVRFLGRRDVDKSAAEDKHLFRVDELMQLGDECDLEVRYFRNRSYENFPVPDGVDWGPDRFGHFFDDYLGGLCRWPPELMDIYHRDLDAALSLAETLDQSGNGPHLHGVFTCTRR